MEPYSCLPIQPEIQLLDHEVLRDYYGNVPRITVRGKRNHDGIYFSVVDVQELILGETVNSDSISFGAMWLKNKYVVAMTYDDKKKYESLTICKKNMRSTHINFSYPRFWDSFRKNENGILVPSNDITVRVWDADYKAMKYQRRVATPFLTRNMEAFKVTDVNMLRTSDSYTNYQLYEHGMFAVMERAALSGSVDALHNSREQQNSAETTRVRSGAVRRKALFIVFPTIHENGHSSFLAGDHFSFVVDQGGSSSHPKPLHFHLTQYVPWEHGQQGDTRHRKNYLPLEFNISSDIDAFKTDMLHVDLQGDHFAKPIHSLLRAPFLPHSRVNSASINLAVGGARQSGRGKALKYVSQRMSNERSFEEMWYELPLHRMIIIGLQRANGVDFTVSIIDRLSHATNTLRRACAFHLANANAHVTDDVIQTRIAQIMADWEWDSFVDPPLLD